MTRAGSIVLALPFLLAAASLCSAQTPAPAPAPAPEPPAAVAEGEDEAFDRPASAARRLEAAKAPYPAVVQRALDEGRQTCVEEGGTGLVPGSGVVRTGDLTGDGRADYIVDFREASCTGRLTVFNGTGGWDLEIFVARRDNGPVRVFAGRVLDYDLGGSLARRKMTFRLHGSYCGRAGADTCVKRRRLDERPFAFRDR